MAKIIKGLLFEGNVAIYAIDGTDIVEDARKVHNTSPVVSAAMGRAIDLCALMSCTFKEEKHRMSATIKGDGEIGSIVVVANGKNQIKACINNANVDLPLNKQGKLDVATAVGSGTLTILKDLGANEPYAGTVELVSGEIAQDFAHYLLTSEQIPSICYAGVLVDVDYSIKASGGIIIQPLPGCNDNHITILESEAEYISRLTQMIGSGMSLENALQEIFEYMDLKILEEITPEYKCDCSKERMEKVLIALPKQDLEVIIEEDKKAQIVCHFCHNEYNFDEEQLKSLL